MKPLDDFDSEEIRVFQELKRLLTKVSEIVGKEPQSLDEGITVLELLRRSVSEDLNQIQHERMIIKAARSLQNGEFMGTQIDWFWNPRQTGTKSEPDLRGVVKGKVVVSAEITASERPIGAIDKRMSTTLTKLSEMPGRRLYYVGTSSMAQRANTKVEKAGFCIEVRCI
jgi:hypothetical protein